MKIFWCLLLCPVLSVACETEYYGSPCFIITKPLVDAVSIYQEGDICTQGLLSDGVCPDYLVGGCAVTAECEINSQAKDNDVFVKKRIAAYQASIAYKHD